MVGDIIKADAATGGDRWAFIDAGNGNIEVHIFDLDHDDEATDTALVDFPDLPVYDFYWDESADARVVVLGYGPDDC